MHSYDDDDLEIAWQAHMRGADNASAQIRSTNDVARRQLAKEDASFHLAMARECRQRLEAERETNADAARVTSRNKLEISASWWLLVVVAMVYYACSGCAGRQVSPHTLPREQTAAAVEIRRECVNAPEGLMGHSASLKSGRGTGAIVDSTHVATVAHVAACPAGWRTTHLSVVLATGRVIQADLEWLDRSRDLARLKLWEEVAGFSKPARLGPARVGAWLCAETAVPARERKCGKLRKRKDQYVEQGAEVDLWLGWGTEPGNSGSAIYDSAGRVVGFITNGGFTSDESLGSSVQGRGVTP